MKTRSAQTDPQPLIKVTAAVLVQEGRVLITQRPANDPLALRWEFPGGKVKAHESPRACLERELKEELGIDVAAGAFIGSHIHRSELHSIQLLVYRVHWLAGTLTVNVHESIAWVRPSQLADYRFAPADQPFVTLLQNGQLPVN